MINSTVKQYITLGELRKRNVLRRAD